ncbi:MAG: putative GTP cyclohydrolase 1 type 2 [Lentisphaerae bacterium ADurb.Bin242]|nr:MAG: putative GTP cyclohydrolase 1 type 2 [Lentisphaerae bacterium ADurb.Bin242]
MQYHKIEVYVPASHAKALKQAMFDAGAGKLGNYDRCCFQTRGTGQFRPLEGAVPFLGSTGEEETVGEWKLEMICADDKLSAVIRALRSAHPYETPAFQHWSVEIQ